MVYIKESLEGQIRVFVKSNFLGRYDSAVLQELWEDMIEEVSVIIFFSKKINLYRG